MPSLVASSATDRALILLGDAVPHIVWGAGPDGTTDYLNAQGAAYAGRSLPAAGTWGWLALVHPEDADRARGAWVEARRTCSALTLEYRLRRHDGVHRWHVARAKPVLDEYGAVVRWIGTAIDVDDAKRQQDADEAMSLLDTAFSQAPFGCGFADRDLQVVNLNERLTSIGGSALADPSGASFAEAVPRLWPQLEASLRRVLATGRAEMDIEVDTPCGADPEQAGHWSVGCFPVSRAEEVIGIGIIVADDSARRQAEANVRFQAEILGAIGQAVVVVDTYRVVTYWNRAAEVMHGWSAADAVGRRSTDLINRDEDPALAAAMVAALRAGRVWSGDVAVRRRDGSPLWVHVTNTPIFGADGELVAVIGTSVDVSERIANEAERHQLAAIVDGSGDAIFSTSIDGTVTSWNRAAQALFGFTAGEIIGRPVAAIAPEDRVEEQVLLRDQLRAGGPPRRLETTRRRKDGSLVDVLLTVSPASEADVVVGASVIATDISERVATRRALETSEHSLAEAQRTAHIGSFELDVASGALTWSAEYRRILGLEPDVVPSVRLFGSLIHPDDLEAITQAWRAATEDGTAIDLPCRIVRPDGSERHVRSRATPRIGDDGCVVAVAGTMADETEQVEADRVRREAESHFEISFDQSATGAVLADLEGFPTRVNQALCDLLGRPPDQLLGQRWTDYTHPDDVAGRPNCSRPRDLSPAPAPLDRNRDVVADERRYVRPDGTTVWASASVTLVRDDAGVPHHYFSQIQDITARKRMEQELSHQALHDSLTGLPNRALLDDRLVRGLVRSRQRSTQLGVVFFDIDDFKLVNDSLGHTVGDEVLRTVGARIEEAIRPEDTVARFGGDEFVIVCDDMAATEPTQLAERIAEAVGRPMLIADQEITLTLSAGIALADRSATPDTLLRDSDAAMYRAKAGGHARIELFDEAARADGDRRLTLISALHRAQERDELRVHYQPIVDLSTGALVCAEALLRWDNARLGPISPEDFIPLAEETGLILSLGAWVLEQACRELVRWQEIHPHLTVAVNLSARQLLAPDIAAVVKDVLARTGLPGSSLCLELTESVFMEDVAYFEATLIRLKALGVRLAIDDFGTGYSSLSYIQRYPIDAVKVDRSFVDGLGTDTHDSALVAAIIAMADALELDVTAEGVETEDQLIRLRDLGCGRAQGFFLARPMPATDMAQVVAEATSWRVP
ncbi:MAG TPA: PAS domain S-box protein [Iamia sp.]|nr:PAS domain S-box protein [Iamia sp.]